MAPRAFRDRVPGPAVTPGETSTTVLGAWYATVLRWRRPAALLIDELTLLPLVMPLAPARSLADGAQTRFLDPLPFEILMRAQPTILTATDDELVECMRIFAGHLKIVVEPTGCLGLAAVRSSAEGLRGQRVGVIISRAGTSTSTASLPSSVRPTPDGPPEETAVQFMSEEQSAALITPEVAYAAVREALIAAASGQATVFPAVIAHGGDPENTFTIKSGSSAQFAGVEIGSYWPGNVDIPRHSTTVVLIDQRTGRVCAAVEAGRVNAYRTAAADAVAADALARPDATTLTVFGTGHQALYECLALSRVRPLEEIHVVARTRERGEQFRAELAGHGLASRCTDAEEACQAADIIVTATTARSPLFETGWVVPGTHVASMGSDQRGKQELPPDLLKAARLFCDLPSQSVAIGEFQHVASFVADGTLTSTAIGDVLTGDAAGRRSPEDITDFDSSGIALQDLSVATALLDAHEGTTRDGTM